MMSVKSFWRTVNRRSGRCLETYKPILQRIDKSMYLGWTLRMMTRCMIHQKKASKAIFWYISSKDWFPTGCRDRISCLSSSYGRDVMQQSKMASGTPASLTVWSDACKLFLSCFFTSFENIQVARDSIQSYYSGRCMDRCDAHFGWEWSDACMVYKLIMSPFLSLESVLFFPFSFFFRFGFDWICWLTKWLFPTTVKDAINSK